MTETRLSDPVVYDGRRAKRCEFSCQGGGCGGVTRGPGACGGCCDCLGGCERGYEEQLQEAEASKAVTDTIAATLRSHQRTRGMAVASGWTCQCRVWMSGRRGETAEDHQAAEIVKALDRIDPAKEVWATINPNLPVPEGWTFDRALGHLREIKRAVELIHENYTTARRLTVAIAGHPEAEDHLTADLDTSRANELRMTRALREVLAIVDSQVGNPLPADREKLLVFIGDVVRRGLDL